MTDLKELTTEELIKAFLGTWTSGDYILRKKYRTELLSRLEAGEKAIKLAEKLVTEFQDSMGGGSAGITRGASGGITNVAYSNPPYNNPPYNNPPHSTLTVANTVGGGGGDDKTYTCGGSNPTYYQPCSSGHVVIWAGSMDYKIPEGTPCACGYTKVHYITCPTCGHERMEMIPI
jgi:hypothetical protein